MPVLVKDFTWKQSTEIVSICVPLKGIHHTNVDILIAENYIKLHFPPFIFEIFLRHKIKESESRCYFTDKESFLELIKVENIQWDKLEADIKKNEMIKLKKKIIEDIQLKTRKHLDEKIQSKADKGRFAVSEAIALDTKRRNKIDTLRDLERKNAMNDFENWRQSKAICYPENSCLEENINTAANKGVIITEIEDEIVSDTRVENVNKDKPLQSQQKPVTKKSNFYTKVISDIATRKVPAPRETSTLKVSFTERIFPTPSRESSARDEEIWLKNITEARRATGFVSEDLRPEEQDPQWCKDKGDEFTKCGNFLGAISAYSHGSKLSDNLPALYSNRSVSHFAIGNYNKCIEDCSRALDLLKPACPANLNSRVKCITRRAAALTRVGMLSKAIDEMKAAIRLQPGNQELKNDLYSMERAWEQDPDSD